MSTSVLPQLLEVDSELSAQASTLEAKLNELKEKRKGIQTVIAMFEAGGTPEAADIAAAVSAPAAKKVGSRGAKSSTRAKTAKAKATKAKTTKTKATKAKTAKAKTTKAKATKASASKSTAKAKSTRGRVTKAKTTAKKGKRSGRTANWQRYVQENYSQSPLPDVIVGVLQAQPSNVFKIADVMSTVFKEDMPQSHFLKARNRVSNILSAGARDGHWYRGRGGTYSASEKAIKAAS